MLIHRTFKMALPAAPILLVVAAALAVGPADRSSQSARVATPQSKTAADTAAASLPQVTVNGQSVPVKPDGTVQFDTGDTHTTVTTNSSGGTTSSSETSTSDGGVSVTVDSHSDQGSGSSFTSVNSSNFSSNFGQSHSSTSVLSTGPAQVQISQ